MIRTLITPFICMLLFTQLSHAEEEELIVKMLETPIKDQLDVNKDIIKQYGNCKIQNGTTSKLSKSCTDKTPPQLRNLFKTYYVNQPKNKQTAALRTKLSKLMGMMIKESSGNPSAVADMKGKGSRTSYKSFFKANESGGIMSRPHYSNTVLLEELLKQDGVTIDKQTNFGLAQLSADRLYIAKWGGNYLSEKKDLIKSFPAKNLLNWCMTRSIYNDKEETLVKYAEKIKSCEIGYKTKEKIKCYARVVNFCPRLTIDLALEQPMKYFETKKAAPLCPKLFE